METPQENLDLIKRALQEDCPDNDVSADLCLSASSQSSAKIIAKEDGVFYGECCCRDIIAIVDSSLNCTMKIKDGQTFKKGNTLLELSGCTKSILKIERTLLNFLQHLCGISTITKQYVDALNNSAIEILDTRKTHPTFRSYQKAAVKAGGGTNHRFSLSDMVLLKENHIHAFLSEHPLDELSKKLSAHKETHPNIPIEIEIETLEELRTWPLEEVDYIMLDNFSIPNIQEGLRIMKNRQLTAKIEVSGNINLDTISNYRQLGIHRISIGRLTHSVKAIDLSLLINR